MNQNTFVCLLSFALLIAGTYAAEVVVSENPSTCAVQVFLKFSFAAKDAGATLSESAGKQIVKTFDEFTSCGTPRYHTQACHYASVEGISGGDCEASMMFFCQGPDTTPSVCKAMDGDDLVGSKIKLKRHRKAIFTKVVIGKGTDKYI